MSNHLEQDPGTLLCEACGYVVDGIHHDDACPECARPIPRSLPAARTGTPWQRQPAVATWCRTAIDTLRHPFGTFERVAIRGDRDRPLLQLNLVIASALIALAAWLTWLWILSRGKALTYGDVVGSLAIASSAGGLGAYLLLRFAVQVEHAGIRFFGARRQWRISDAVASTVVAHASIGWILGGLLACASTFVRFEGLPRLTLFIWTIGPAVWILVLAVGVGMLVFELLVYVGVRRCRYANAAPPLAAPRVRMERA